MTGHRRESCRYGGGPTGTASATLGPVLIIGYGNPLRGDDGFGFRAAEQIPGAIAVHQLTPELQVAIAGADGVIFLDATGEGIPGEIRRRAISAESGAASFTHHATPEALVAGARQLYGHAPAAVLISVCGADFSVSDTLSAAVCAALDSIVAELRNH